MTEAEPEPRPSLTHRAEYVLYRALEWFLNQMPLEVITTLGSVLGTAAWWFFPKYRRLATRNLRIATAAEAPDHCELQRLVRETFTRAGGNMLASMRTSTLRYPALDPYLKLHGMEHLLAAHAAGFGTVVVWAHMGNWEMLAQIFPYLGRHVQGGPIYRPLANPLVNQLVNDRRIREGAHLFNKHDGFLKPAAALRAGETVTIMSDQRAGGHGELCPFFGRLSSCTPLPSLLARRAKAKMVALSIRLAEDGAWHINVRPIPSKAKTPEIMEWLELAMRDQLTDVFWFHDRWRVDRTHPLSFYTKESPTEPAKLATVPTRLVATLPPDCPESVETLRQILHIRPDARIVVLDGGQLPVLPEDDRITTFLWDPEGPPEHFPGVLQQCDESHPAPLDFALLLDGHRDLAVAAKKLGLRSIIGCGSAGKPWTRSFPRPTNEDGWRELADELAATPSSGKA